MKSFGVPLSQAPRIKGRMIPSVLDTLITYLDTHALSTEGLFRVSGNALRVKELIAELDSGADVDLSKYEHTTIAETLKKYFHDLPEPIVPPLIDHQVKSLFGGIRRPAEEILPEMKFAVDSLSEINFAVLERLSKLLAGIVTHSDKNKMSLPNVVTCIAPTMRFTPAILTYCIVHHKHFFDSNPAAPPEELKILAEGASSVIPGSASPSSSITQRLVSLTKHNRKTSVPTPLPSPKMAERDEEFLPTRDSLKEKSINIKEELMNEKLRLQEDLISKERKSLKDEFNKERQLMIEEVMREKDMMKEEIHREKGYLKELYSKEKRVYKDEVRRLRKELDMARTVIQTLKDKIDTFAEVNYELERKLKKQQLKNKAMQLDIEGLRRRIAKTSHLGESSKSRSDISPRDLPRDLSNARGGSSTISSSYEQGYSDSDDDSVAKRDDDTEEDVVKRYDDKRSKSRGKRRSLYIKSGSSSNIEEKLAENVKEKEKKEKAKELLKKNSNKLAEVSLHARMSTSLDVDDVL